MAIKTDRSGNPLWGPGCKLMFGFAIVKNVDMWLRYHAYLVPRGIYEDPLMWWGAVVAIMAACYVFTPKVNAWDQQTFGNDLLLVAVIEIAARLVQAFCDSRGHNLGIPSEWWRSWFVVDGLALTLSTLFIQRADKEVSHGSRP